jgi:glycosyltransferase involved in cell wall biosynthesis
MMTLRDPSHIVMVGTSFQTRGGIAAVLEAYRNAGLFDRWPIDYVATHRDGSRLLKFLKAIDGLVVFVAMLCRHPRAVLHVHSASRASFWRKSVIMALALAARWPVIFHLHGGGFATFYDAECGPVRRALVRFFLDRAACIVVVSERWCAWMHRATRNPRIVSIANPVTMPPAAALPREEALVAFAGRCAESKGIFDLVAATAALAPERPGLRLECAGDGDLEAVRSRARELGLGTRVALPGWIARRPMNSLLARATVFALPSHAEGMPVALLEAMAAGCPVVASAVGGIPDLIDDGFNGLLVPAGDPAALARAIARLLDDPPLAAAMGRAARATIASRFTAERSVETLGRLYASFGIREQHPVHTEGGESNAKPGDGPGLALRRIPGPSPVEIS